MPDKKVVLFIVEGITDETAIGHIVKRLNKDKKVFFQIVQTDITTQDSSNVSNIESRINEQIKLCMKQMHFTIKDIIKIIHLVDLDGAFVSDDAIVFKDTPKIEYDLEHIYTSNIEFIRKRNQKKKQILNRLSSTQRIRGIPYSIYYFSTNMEHVFHNQQNVKDDEEKLNLANEIQDKFYDNPVNFIEFINDDKYALKDTYENTWEFIKKDNNSLKRYTNFNLYFE